MQKLPSGEKKVETCKDRLVRWAFFLFPCLLAHVVYLLAWRVGSSWRITWKIFLVPCETFIVNSTSWAHVLPSSFIQQVTSCAAPRAWILLIDSTMFLSECMATRSFIFGKTLRNWDTYWLVMCKDYALKLGLLSFVLTFQVLNSSRIALPGPIYLI